MADLQLVLRLLADAQSALTALGATQTALKATGTAAQSAQPAVAALGAEVRDSATEGSAALAALRADLGELQARFVAAQGTITGLSAELARLRSLPAGPREGVEGLGKSSVIAAGSVGNLAAQWNDVIMMTAAGQSPMMLAIQQGGQIGQALGQGGAAGAVRMLAASFMGLLSPMNLAVMAAIAVGSALVQALTSSTDKTKDLDAAVRDLDAAVKGLAARAKVDVRSLQEEFGAVTPEVVRLNSELTALANVDGIIALKDAIQSLKAETEGSWWGALPFTDASFRDKDAARNLLGAPKYVGIAPDGLGVGIENPEIERFQALLDRLANTTGAQAQLDILRQINAMILQSTGGIDQMTTKQLAYYASVVSTERGLRAMVEEQRRAKEAQDALARSQRQNRPEMVGEAPISPQRAKDEAAAMAQLAIDRQQADLADVIRQHGEDSAAAALARLEADRADHLAWVNNLEVSIVFKDALMQAWDAKKGIADAQLAAAIEAAIGPASRLAAILQPLGALRIGVPQINGGIATVSGAFQSAWEGVQGWFRSPEAPTSSPRPPAAPPDLGPGIPTATGGGAGGGTSLTALQRQAEAAIKELDTATAAMQERVRAGLMTTAEAADGVDAARRRAGNALADLIPQIAAMGPAGAAAAETWREALGQVADQLRTVGDTGSQVAEDVKGAFKSSFAGFLAGTKSAGDAWDDLLSSINRSIAEKLSARFTDNIFGPMIDGLMSGIFGSVTPHAAGGVPGQTVGRLGSLANQVVSAPIFFPMPGGLGLAGEAGDEAIMPLVGGRLAVRAVTAMGEMPLDLTRASDGALAVTVPWIPAAAMAPRLAFAQGGVPGSSVPRDPGPSIPGSGGWGGGTGRGMDVSVQIINNGPPVTATTSLRETGNGVMIEAILEAVKGSIAGDVGAGRGDIPAVLEGAYGLSRVAR